FCLELLLTPAPGRGELAAPGGWLALFLALAALAASVFHLGRPQYAFRAFLGLRTSWLSREIIGFGLFSGLAALYAGSYHVPPAWQVARMATGTAAALSGALAVFCSVMVYVATRRPHWRGSATGLRFFGTTLVAGTATLLLALFGRAL